MDVIRTIRSPVNHGDHTAGNRVWAVAVAADQEGEAMKSNRLDTMARFEEPKDPKVVFICPECKYEFCEGDPVEEVDGQNMCLDCADDWYASLRKSNKRVLEVEE